MFRLLQGALWPKSHLPLTRLCPPHLSWAKVDPAQTYIHLTKQRTPAIHTHLRTHSTHLPVCTYHPHACL